MGRNRTDFYCLFSSGRILFQEKRPSNAKLYLRKEKLKTFWRALVYTYFSFFEAISDKKRCSREKLTNLIVNWNKECRNNLDLFSEWMVEGFCRNVFFSKLLIFDWILNKLSRSQTHLNFLVLLCDVNNCIRTYFNITAKLGYKELGCWWTVGYNEQNFKSNWLF